MRIRIEVSLLAIILIMSGLLGFAAFNIPEAKAQAANILVGGPVNGYPAYGSWTGHRGNRTSASSTVRYTVNITNVAQLWSFDFTLAWGLKVLALQSKTVKVPQGTGDGILNSPVSLSAETSLATANRTAVYRLAYTQSGLATPWTWATGKGCAVYLDFKILSPTGECDIYFLESKLSFKNGSAISHTRTEGYFYLSDHKRVPTASFTTSPATKVANKTSVTFNGAASNDPDGGGALTYIWNYGHDKIVTGIQSAHPYLSNTNIQFPLTHTNAIRMRVKFFNITVEDDMDWVRVKDKNGVILNEYTGSLKNQWSQWGLGDTLYINFTSDGSVNMWGFTADRYNFILQVATAAPTYTYTIVMSDYPTTLYGPYPITASLSVIDTEHSQSKTVSTAFQIVHPRPVARFTMTPNITHYHPNIDWAYIFCGKTVNFDASSSFDPDTPGGILWYSWDFGDGTKANKTTPTTSYNYWKTGGPLSIGLTVKDSSDGMLGYWSYNLRVYNISEFGRAFGATEGTPPYIPPSANWNSFYEIIPDRIINATDLLIVGKSYY